MVNTIQEEEVTLEMRRGAKSKALKKGDVNRQAEEANPKKEKGRLSVYKMRIRRIMLVEIQEEIKTQERVIKGPVLLRCQVN